MNKLTIFLSSTKQDLEQARLAIIKFLSVLKGNLVAMEVFGSDESQPKEFCLQQVRESNLFIGVYAERYGYIDPESGLSMTELEYWEAVKMLQEGRLLGLLLYVIDPKSQWPINLIDRNPDSVEKLGSFKRYISEKHTITFFSSAEELPFAILRDVIRKLGLGTQTIFRPKKERVITRKKSLARPVGMEYYTGELSPFFQGRTKETDNLVDQLIKNKMTLLIGASGIGKTSLLHAGVFPQLRDIGWRPAIIRPVADPIDNLATSLWQQLMEGASPQGFDFTAVSHSVATAHEDAPVLIAIDQFEDVLGVKAREDIGPLTQALVDLYTSSEENLRFLISYRGDYEAQIGPIWQKVSGSPDGLPRLYLGPLAKESCGDILMSNLNALRIRLLDSSTNKEQAVKDQIINDLFNESLVNGFAGVYPPFLQMVISRIASDAQKGEYAAEEYESAGRARKMISDYLISQLRYLGKNEQRGREILIALVSSYGVKTQKTIEEISFETSETNDDVEKLLQSLIDLRMVRSIGNHYEIVHDYLAKTILAELVSTDEREAKKFKDLLSSRAAAFPDTKSSLSLAEHLLIYKYRSKILCSPSEITLLISSCLTERRPVFFWLRSYSREEVINTIQSLLSEADEQFDSVSYRQNGYRLLIKLGLPVPLEEISRYFKGFRVKSELKDYIVNLAAYGDIPLLTKMSGSRVDEIAQSAEEALLNLISMSDEEVLAQLSRTTTRRFLFEELAAKFSKELTLKNIRGMLSSDVNWKRLLGLYALGEKGSNSDLEALQIFLSSKKTGTGLKIAATKSIIKIADRSKKPEIIKGLLESTDRTIVDASREALESPNGSLNIKELLPAIALQDNSQSAAIIRGLSTKKDLPLLKKMLQDAEIIRSDAEIVLAICEHGGGKEFDFLFNIFLSTRRSVELNNAYSVLEAMASIATRKHYRLMKEIIDSEGFWDTDKVLEVPRHKITPAYNNEYLIRWITGVTFSKLATRKDLPTLLKLLKHKYWTVRNSAAAAIVRLGDVSDLQGLVDYATSFKGEFDGILKAACDLDERIYGDSKQSV